MLDRLLYSTVEAIAELFHTSPLDTDNHHIGHDPKFFSNGECFGNPQIMERHRKIAGRRR